MFNVDSYSITTKNFFFVQIVLLKLKSLNIVSFSNVKDSKSTRRQQKNNKFVVQVKLTTKIKQYSTDFVVSTSFILKFKTDKITILNSTLYIVI